MAQRFSAIALAICTALITSFAVAAPASGATDASGRSGDVRFVKRMTPEFDRYVTGNNAANRTWINNNLWRTEVFTPFFDDKTSWYGNGWVYSDLYAVYNGSSLASQHPDWILKDPSGNKLFIPWGCGGGTCPQYAADITNPAYRAAWISTLKTNLAKGYRGAWIDDVNLERRVGNGSGAEIAPYSPTLGRVMSAADWRKAMADFTEQVRREVPQNYELLHNSIWYAGQGVGRDANPDVARQIASADYINIERGFNDGGLTGGTGEWSISAVHAFVDRVHAKGKGVIVDAFDDTAAGMEYSLANYLLINTGLDGVGEIHQTPDNWWKGWDTDLGTATTDRYAFSGAIRRDFSGGMVLVNEPQARTITVTLPQPMVTITGATVSRVTLAAGQGAVLRGVGVTSAPSAPPAAPKPTTPATPSAPSTPATPTAPTAPTPPAAPTTPATPVTPTCRQTVITYRTLRWSTKKRKLVAAKSSTKVCLSVRLQRGTKAHRLAIHRVAKSAQRQDRVKAIAAGKAKSHHNA